MTAPTTTLAAIRAHSPCADGWSNLLAGLGKTAADDEPLTIRRIYEINGLDDALWCLRALPPGWDNRVRLLVCDLVEPALAFIPEGETRPAEALRIARAFARGEATAEQLAAARDAVLAAVWDAVWDAAWAAARAAARDARGAVWAAARDAERDAARAARDAAWAAHARIFEAWLDAMEQEESQ